MQVFQWLINDFLKWSLAYQLGFSILAVLTPMCWIFAHNDAIKRSLREEKILSESVINWRQSPVVTSFVAEEALETISIGAGRDEVYRLRLFRGRNEKVADVSVFRIYEGSFWRLGEAENLYVTKTARADIKGWLQSERIRALLMQSDEVLCIGLTSAKGPRESQEDLSLRRARRLKELLLASGNFQSDRVHPVPFGQALGPVPRDEFEEQWQRSAIIIGISQLDKALSREVMYDEILRRVPIKNVDLKNYSRVSALTGRVKTDAH